MDNLDSFALLDSPLFEQNFLADWTPRVDISDTPRQVKIKVNVPNVDPDEIKIEVDDHSLCISGETEESTEEKGETWYRSECQSGSFSRTIGLPSNLDLENIKAKSKNGTLIVTIKKLKEANKKTVPVES